MNDVPTRDKEVQAHGDAMPKEIWARVGRALETRSATTAAYNVRRTVRRRNGTPGGGCACCARRRAGAEIGRTPRSCAIKYQWLSRELVLDQLEHAEQGNVVAAELVTAWRRFAAQQHHRPSVPGRSDRAKPQLRHPSRMHSRCLTNSANIHAPRTAEARNLRLRCARRDINCAMREH